MENLLMALLLVGILVGIVVATRKKPGRRYDKKAPGRGDADKDNWSFPG